MTEKLRRWRKRSWCACPPPSGPPSTHPPSSSCLASCSFWCWRSCRLYQGLRAEEAAGAGVRLLSSTSPPESPTILHLFLPSFNVSWPLQLHFLRRISMSGDADMMQHSQTKYLMELCLPKNEMAHQPPSVIAATALLVFLRLLQPEVTDHLTLTLTLTLTRQPWSLPGPQPRGNLKASTMWN
jgi:hypothetical protein